MNDANTTPKVFDLGTLHGVLIQFVTDGKSSVWFPVGDETGTQRPGLIIGKDFDLDALFDKVCFIRGRYDLDRALSGEDPFDWGSPGTWSDVHPIMEAIKRLRG